MKDGLAGRIAKLFIGSKLTVLLMIVFMVIGVYSSFLIPREEEPQMARRSSPARSRESDYEPFYIEKRRDWDMGNCPTLGRR